MNEENKLELGAEAAGLLYALRAFEAAKEYYFNAQVSALGEELASRQLVEQTPTWQAAEDLIENALSTHFREWASEAQMRSIV